MFFDYVALDDDTIQIIDQILFYLGHQNQGDNRIFYFDVLSRIYMECDWNNNELSYNLSHWTNKRKDPLIIKRGSRKYINKYYIPKLLDIYNNIPQDTVHEKIVQIEREKENDRLLEKTELLRAICWSLLEYEDDHFKIVANTHRERDDDWDYSDVIDGFKVILSNNAVVLDFSNRKVSSFLEGSWIKYFKQLRNNNFKTEEDRDAYIKRLLMNEEHEKEESHIYNSNRFDYFDFPPMDNNKYVVSNKVKVRKKGFE